MSNPNQLNWDATDYTIILTNYVSGEQDDYPIVVNNYHDLVCEIYHIVDSIHEYQMENQDHRFSKSLTNVHVFETCKMLPVYSIIKNEDDELIPF